MISEEEAAAAVDMCACCGIAAVDDVTLKKCACNLVKYCGEDCHENHRPQHEEECKNRLAEIRDKDLFALPDISHLGECPICCLPLPIDQTKSTFMSCCSKSICNGCKFANEKRENEAGLQQRCVYCREPAPETDEEVHKNVMERIKKNNDPAAMRHMAKKYYHREGDNETAVKYFIKAAELGDADAHYNLSCMYREGLGVEKDMKKLVYHLEEAAIGGHPNARYNLGCEEENNGNFDRARFDRATKHFIIAANLGHDNSLKGLKGLYADGLASKEDYAGALRAYQAAVDATKSEEREKAEEAIKNGDW
jgi:TPR repeat protein